MKKTVILMCDSIQRYKFMKRLALSMREFEPLFVTGEPLVKLYSILCNIDCVFVSGRKSKKYVIEGINDSIELLTNQVSEEQLICDSNSIVFYLENEAKKRDISHAIIWNGQQLLGRSLSFFSKKHNIKRVYLEISNLPSKLFADAGGVNALSTISKDISKLDELSEVDNRLHEEWLVKYKASKKKPLPQAKSSLSNKLEGMANRVLKKLLKGVGFRQLSLKELKAKSVDISSIVKFEKMDYNHDFIFLPLQVSTDTQIKLHSKIDNEGAIKNAVVEANNRNFKLIIKVHPAEQSIDELEKIEALRKKFNFKIVSNNTVELIERAALVITINSTVGLESKIFDKKVIVLGNAFYKEFDNVRLLKYIHHFLHDDIDYFSDSKLATDKVNKILSC